MPRQVGEHWDLRALTTLPPGFEIWENISKDNETQPRGNYLVNRIITGKALSRWQFRRSVKYSIIVDCYNNGPKESQHPHPWRIFFNVLQRKKNPQAQDGVTCATSP